MASEGVVYAHIDGSRGVMVELNCETDFVARTDDFPALAKQIAEFVGAHPGATVESVMADPGILDSVNEKVAKLGERIVLKRVETVEGGPNTVLASYIHTGGKIGVMVEGEIPEGGDAAGAKALLRDIAMHTAAAKPEYLSREHVPEEIVAQEREIHEAWARGQNKPESALVKIVTGRLEKLFFEAQVLLDQLFVRDQDKSIKTLLKESPTGVTLKRFIKMRVGE